LTVDSIIVAGKWGIGEVLTEFWWGNLRERVHLDVLGLDGRISLK
jgi:hypothetical protein